MKKLISLVLILLISFNFTVISMFQAKKAEAIVPALVALAPEAVPLVANALVAAGITYQAADTINSASQWWYSNTTQQCRDDITNSVANIANGATEISTTVWDNMKTWAHDGFQLGDNTNYADYEASLMDNVISTAVAGYTCGDDGVSAQGFKQLAVYNSSGIKLNDYLVDSANHVSNYGLIKQGSYIFAAEIYDNYLVKLSNTAVGLYTAGYPFKAHEPVVYTGQSQLANESANNPIASDGYIKISTSQPTVGSIAGNVTVPQAITNTNVGDVTQDGASVAWPVASGALSYNVYLNGQPIYNTTSTNYTFTGLSAGTGYDVVVRPVNTVGEGVGTNITINTSVPPVTIPAAPSSLISSNVTDNSISLDWSAVPGTDNYLIYVDGVLIATLSGVLTKDITGLSPATTYDISVSAENTAGESAQTHTSVRTLDNVVNLPIASNGIDLTPLKLAGTLFTTKFPFSLPWDFKNSFTQLNGGNFNTRIDINVPNTNILKGMCFSIDFAQFQSIVNVMKVIELLCFDIGLIILTRRLLGGDV